MTEKSIAIIGAGIAGLSAGCYGRMNGYRTTIFEHHTTPGGLCTAWHRKGYGIDGCVHWLMGAAPGSNLYRIWEELGALAGREFVYADEYFRLEDADGRVLVAYCNLDKLVAHFKQVSPADSVLIDELAAGVRTFMNFDMPVLKAPELQTWLDRAWWIVRHLPLLGAFKKWGQLSIADYAAKFKDPLLQQGIRAMFLPGFPALFMLLTLATMHERSSGYPIGGSLPFARAIEKRYRELGGEVRYCSRAEKILVDGGKAVGVRLADGTEHSADYVVSAADGHATIFDMLDGKFVDEKLKHFYDSSETFPGIALIGLGVARKFDDVPQMVSGFRFALKEPLIVGTEPLKWLHVRVHNQDPALAPEGKTVVTCLIGADWKYWTELKTHPEEYQAAKKKLADDVIARLEQRFPGISDQIEMADVATPATFQRYTLNWKCSFEGWLATPQNFMARLPKTLPGLANFYMAGQWVEIGGGLPPAGFSGRHVLQLICKADGKPFTASRAIG